MLDGISRRATSGLESDGTGMDAGTEGGETQELRTLLHLLNNQVTMASGYAQLLSLEPDLPPSSRRRLANILTATTGAAGTLAQMQAVLYRAPERGSQATLPTA